MPICVAFIAAECEPWAKTGGLADVVDALARALGSLPGRDLDGPVDVYLPRYRGIEPPAERVVGSRRITVPTAAPARGDGPASVDVIDVQGDGYRLRLVDHPASFDRSGYYGDAAGDYADNAARFALFCRAALETMRAEERVPDVIHLHDWHAGPLVRYADPSPDGPATILTVHNLAYHGWTPPGRVRDLGVEWTEGPGSRSRR